LETGQKDRVVKERNSEDGLGSRNADPGERGSAWEKRFLNP